MQKILALVCATAAGACAAGDPAGVSVELGAAGASWQPLEEGAVVEIRLGAQGGQHMDASARISGLWPGERRDGTDDPRVGFSVVGAGGEVWSAALRPVRRPFIPCAVGGFELDGGGRIYLVDGASLLGGEELEVRIDVEDAFGVTASDSRLVTVRVIADR